MIDPTVTLLEYLLDFLGQRIFCEHGFGRSFVAVLLA